MAIVSELMSRGVRSVTPADSAQAAARLMEATDGGLVPVCLQGQLIGVVTAHDLVRSMARGLPPYRTPVGTFMTVDAPRCYADQTFEEATRMASGLPHARLPVIDRSGQLVGMLMLH